LDEKEIYWISHYNTCDSSIGYNSLAGGSMRFEYLTEERKNEAIEKICLGNGKGWFDVYDYRDGTLVGTWCNTHEAARILGVQQQNISHCLSNRIDSIGNFVFVLKTEDNYENVKDGKVAKGRKNNYNPILCFDLKGKMIGRYETCGEAARALNFNRNNAYKVLSGKEYKVKDMVLINERKYSEEVLINKLDLANRAGRYEWFVGFDLRTGERIGRWSSNKQASLELNISPSMLRKHLIPSKKEKSVKRIKRYIFILDSENIEKIKKEKVLAIVECKSTKNKAFVKNNPSIFEMLK
jgi:hypothetical protein